MQDQPAGSERLRVLIVDRHEVSRAAYRALLRTEGLDVVADVAPCGQAIAAARELSPDLAIVDISPGDGQGLDIARRLRVLSAPPAVVLTSSTDRFAFDPQLSGFAFIPKADISAGQILLAEEA